MEPASPKNRPMRPNHGGARSLGRRDCKPMAEMVVPVSVREETAWGEAVVVPRET
jgi:hypothetical protein